MQTLTNADKKWQDEALASFFNIVEAPDGDFEAIDQLARTLNDAESLKLMIEFLSRHQQGKQAFIERPLLGDIIFSQLLTLPQNTLGYVYADHMTRNGLKPLPAGKVESDLQFFRVHTRETHDLWHVVTGFDTSIFGEMQLQAFYMAQLNASRFWSALLIKNLLKTVVYDIELVSKYMDGITRGWTMAQRAEPLFGIRWNTLWETPLQDIRTSLNIILV